MKEFRIIILLSGDLSFIFRRKKNANYHLKESDTQLEQGTFETQCISLHTPQNPKTPPELFSEAMTGKMSVNAAIFILAGVKAKTTIENSAIEKHNSKYQNIYHVLYTFILHLH
jgi:hypothetical protein